MLGQPGQWGGGLGENSKKPHKSTKFSFSKATCGDNGRVSKFGVIMESWRGLRIGGGKGGKEGRRMAFLNFFIGERVKTGLRGGSNAKSDLELRRCLAEAYDKSCENSARGTSQDLLKPLGRGGRGISEREM